MALQICRGAGGPRILGIDLSRKMIKEAQKRNNGFSIEAVEEAEPPKEMMDIPGMRDEMRRLMMLLVKAIAKK